jgi:hypothetical protein
MRTAILITVALALQFNTITPVNAITKSSNSHKIGFTTRDASECRFWLFTDTGKIKKNVMAVSRGGIYMNIDGSDIELSKISSRRTNADGKTINNANGVRIATIYKAGKFQIKEDTILVDSNWNYRGNIQVSQGNWNKNIKVRGFCDYFG